MSSGPFIAAFDIATATGVCDGNPGSRPRCFTWFMSDAGDLRPFKLCYFRNLLDEYFKYHNISAVYYEAPLNIRTLMTIGASDDTVALLRGAVGVLESCAVHAGIEVVEAVPVQTARKTLTGHGTFKRIKGKSAAKDAIMAAAGLRGVHVTTDHEADAYAVWYHAAKMGG